MTVSEAIQLCIKRQLVITPYGTGLMQFVLMDGGDYQVAVSQTRADFEKDQFPFPKLYWKLRFVPVNDVVPVEARNAPDSQLARVHRVRSNKTS